MSSRYEKRGLWYFDINVEGKRITKNTYLKATRANIKEADKIINLPVRHAHVLHTCQLLHISYSQPYVICHVPVESRFQDLHV